MLIGALALLGHFHAHLCFGEELVDAVLEGVMRVRPASKRLQLYLIHPQALRRVLPLQHRRRRCRLQLLLSCSRLGYLRQPPLLIRVSTALRLHGLLGAILGQLRGWPVLIDRPHLPDNALRMAWLHRFPDTKLHFFPLAKIYNHFRLWLFL